MNFSLIDTCFLELLLEADVRTAREVRKCGCPLCGGELDVSNYSRKVRGIEPEWEKWFCERLSFCCRKCRKRTTPTSVRFLGRKVYWALVLASERFRRLLEIGKKTLKRWAAFWGEIFSKAHPFLKIARGLLPAIGDLSSIETVAGYFEKPGESYSYTAFRLLRFFSPLSSNYLGTACHPQKMARDAFVQ